MALSDMIRKLLSESGTGKPKILSLEEIRRGIFEASRNMEMRNREAAAAEAKAQAALQKTFQPGLGQMVIAKLLAEHNKYLKQAKELLGYANQFGSVLQTLESADIFLEKSEAISQSNIAGAGKMNVREIMDELQQAEAIMEPIARECQNLKHLMESSLQQFKEMVMQDEPEGQAELLALYSKLEAEPDPVKKAAIQAEIEAKTYEAAGLAVG